MKSHSRNCRVWRNFLGSPFLQIGSDDQTAFILSYSECILTSLFPQHTKLACLPCSVITSVHFSHHRYCVVEIHRPAVIFLIKGQLYGAFLVVSLKKLLNKQSHCRWFDSEWYSCNVLTTFYVTFSTIHHMKNILYSTHNRFIFLLARHHKIDSQNFFTLHLLLNQIHGRQKYSDYRQKWRVSFGKEN